MTVPENREIIVSNTIAAAGISSMQPQRGLLKHVKKKQTRLKRIWCLSDFGAALFL